MTLTRNIHNTMTIPISDENETTGEYEIRLEEAESKETLFATLFR